MRYYFFSKSDMKDQKTITDAMHKLMYDVATPKPGTTQRTACVYFRPRVSTDKVFLKIQYGNGCSATVSTCLTLRSLLQDDQ
jgi:hypothetical protein